MSFLQRVLEVKLKDLGDRKAKLWRDAGRFSNGDPYDVEIEDALRKSALLIVVMSRNWLSRPYCRKELDDFIPIAGTTASGMSVRMVVIGNSCGHRPGPLNPLFLRLLINRALTNSPTPEMAQCNRRAGGRQATVKDIAKQGRSRFSLTLPPQPPPDYRSRPNCRARPPDVMGSSQEPPVLPDLTRLERPS